MLPETLELIRKLTGRGTAEGIQKLQAKQQRNVEKFLRNDLYSGNFNVAPEQEEDSIPSDAFGDW
jgi:hypothetical protein